MKHAFPNARAWYDAEKYPDEQGVNRRKRVLADDYIKAFAFVLDAANPRMADFDAMVKLAANRGWKLVFNLVPENMEYADSLLGEAMTAQIRHNRDFLVQRYHGQGAVVVDNLDVARGSEFTDQFWTTEHVNGRVRQACARNVAKTILGAAPQELRLQQNNWPNPAVLQPMADTLLGIVPQR
jgi:glycosidase